MPRILGGSARGRKIRSPADGVRPATARSRKSLFDYLTQFIPDKHVLDLYCGSGGLGLEALSRGAATAWFVDAARLPIEFTTANCETLGFSGRVKLIQQDVFSFLKTSFDGQSDRFDLVFAAPPYKTADPQKLLDRIAQSHWIADGAVICLEYSKHTDRPSHDRFTMDRRKVFGETVIEVWDYLSGE